MHEYFFLAHAVNNTAMKSNGIVEAVNAKEALELATKQAEYDFDYVNTLVIQLNKVS